MSKISKVIDRESMARKKLDKGRDAWNGKREEK